MASIRVENYLKSQLKKKNTLIFVLIDSEVSKNTDAVTLAKKVEKLGASAILVGGARLLPIKWKWPRQLKP